MRYLSTGGRELIDLEFHFFSSLKGVRRHPGEVESVACGGVEREKNADACEHGS